MRRKLKCPKAGEGGPFHVFHQMYRDGAPTMYVTQGVEIKGAFVHFVDDKGDEQWLSGSLAIRRAPKT